MRGGEGEPRCRSAAPNAPGSDGFLVYFAPRARLCRGHVVFVYEPDFAYTVPALLDMPRFTAPEEAEERSLVHLRELAKEYAPDGKTPSRTCLRPNLQAGRQNRCGPDRHWDAREHRVKHVLLGSTAERVVRHAPCPVLVVRDTEGAPEPQIRGITAWLRVLGMVNVALGKTQIAPVINGFSNLIIEVFGSERGGTPRSAVGMAELPFGVPVEIEAEVEIE